MKKELIFFWYIPSFEWHNIYDLHLKNLSYYHVVFDKKTFILATDEIEIDKINRTKEKILKVVPDAEFISYGNDKQLRESLFFYNEIALKLNTFNDNEALFFAHNKGVSSNYVSKDDLNYWINMMYYCNLNNMNIVDNYLNNGETYSIGTLCYKKWNPWASYPVKYKWHYSGTFFWIIPSRINKYIIDNKITIPKNNRYFTEAFLGNIISDNEKYAKVIFEDRKCGEGIKAYFERTFSKEEKEKYYKLYE